MNDKITLAELGRLIEEGLQNGATLDDIKELILSVELPVNGEDHSVPDINESMPE